MNAYEVGQRKSIHRAFTSRASTLIFDGRCNIPADAEARELTANELASVTIGSPKRLCGHCFRTRDA